MREDTNPSDDEALDDDVPLTRKILALQQLRLRKLRGLTQEELADLAKYSVTQVRGVERGRRKATRSYIEAIDAALNAEGLLIATAQDLIDKSKFPEWFEEFAQTERAARRLYSYSAHAIDGLLQTKEHAHAVTSAYVPTLDDDRVEELVVARLERQALLTRKPQPTLGFVLEQVVLERPIGGRDVHQRQLEHLIRCAEMRNVSIQVLETNMVTHVGLDGPMTLLETPEGQTLGYVEVQGVSQIIAAPVWVGDLEQRYGIIRSQALSPERSLGFIKELVGAL
ncbi:helix-turn-helix domain-containing protein [Streptomyces noursei]|uniref:helix-turn-helix domain-containing protein n=1 Tax=Streptomyces noursei TaxID=1971 RepID=UPI00081CB0E9|nr:DNA-binding protein [Streptomyces noursei ATCC 11455]ANZ21876.1 DNA-binding protein [Streptomyces noursei ATCC 11455]MCZ0996481.1 helix-turn-helix transcriptional regulator [Streptomyces noursei]